MRRALAPVVFLLACGGAPEPVSPTRVETKPTDAPKKEARVHARTLPPLPPDIVPATLGTPASSLAARPFFGYQGYAPQLRYQSFDFPLPTDPCEFFRGAPPATAPAGAIRGGDMLICAAVTDHTEQKFAFNLALTSVTKADVNVEVELVPPKKMKDALVVKAEGRGDAGAACFTLPVIELDKGWSVQVHAKDRGIFTTDADFGTVRLAFDPQHPIEGANASFGVECRRVPRAAVEERIRQGLAALDAQIDSLDRTLLVDLDDVEWGRIVLVSARAPLEWTAAWSGWDDPRLRLRIERLVALEQRFEAELHQEIEKKVLLPKGLASVKGMNLSIEPLFLSCGDKRFEALRGKPNEFMRGRFAKLACVLGLRVRNDGAKPLEVFLYTSKLNGVDVVVADTLGRRFMTDLVGMMKDGAVTPFRNPPVVDAGATVDLLVDVRSNEYLPHTMFAPDVPPLQSTASLEPFVLEVAHASDRFRIRVPVP